MVDKELRVQNNQEVIAEDEINLLELLQVMVRRRDLIIKVTLGVAIVSVIYSLFMTNIYTATTKILPPQKDSGGGTAAALLSQLGGAAGGIGAMAGFGGTADLYVGIIQSRSVTDALISRLNLQKELEIKKITLKICDYENYLKFIFQEINKKTKLPIVEWLT